jgi:hypothetical protein
MSPGLVHPGTWAMTRRDTQITWLIRFSAAWKQLPGHEQQALAADPWKLKEFTGQVDAPSASSAQMALLHLAHPETFDPTVSADHKRWITNRFLRVIPPAGPGKLDEVLFCGDTFSGLTPGPVLLAGGSTEIPPPVPINGLCFSGGTPRANSVDRDSRTAVIRIWPG